MEVQIRQEKKAPQDYLNEIGPPRGIMYTERYKKSPPCFHVAVSASLSGEMLTLPRLLIAIVESPGSSFKLYLYEHRLRKLF